MCDDDSDSRHEEVKKRKLNDQAKQNQNENLNESEIQNANPSQNQLSNSENMNQSAVAGSLNEENSSQIFKMDIDCFEELFDYLSVYDLFAIRLTCKRFKKIVNYYIRTNYPGMGRFHLTDKNFDMFCQMDAGTIGLINEIDILVSHSFDVTKFESIKELLSKVPKISITNLKADVDFYNCFLKYCNNVKNLYIKRSFNLKPISNINNEWLSHHYPSLECVRFDDIWKDEINEFVAFFRLNPNVHAFSIGLESLQKIGLDLIAAGIKFNRLYTHRYWIDKETLDLLKRLYNDGFYSRFHLTLDNMILKSEEEFNKLNSIGIEVLNIENLNFIIPPLPSLRELYFGEWPESVEHYENVKNIVERLTLGTVRPNDILAFIGNMPKLKHFKIYYVHSTDILDLITLNKERSKLTGACKTTIYVDEEVFLATKWAKTKTNFDFTELKRIEACDWDQFFENNCGKCAIKLD